MKFSKSYDYFMRPLEKGRLGKARKVMLSKASGDVIEIGAGTGVSLPHYKLDAVTSLTLVDETIHGRVRNYSFGSVAVDFLESNGENLPYANCSFDFACSFLAICSLRQPFRTLTELKRVLRPGGQLIFVEHTRPSGVVGLVFDGANILWKSATKGCNINRNIVNALEVSGFKIKELGRFGVFVFGVAEKI